MSVVGIVPARGGSKSIPRKNLRPFGGHPLIAWTIAAARQALTIERVIVSTDDAEIAEVARRYGAEVPFLRPPEFALDDTPDLPVFTHALGWLATHLTRVELVVHLRPTSPLRADGLIDEGVARLRGNARADCVRAVTETTMTPYKMWRPAEGLLRPLLDDAGPEAFNAPRQALPKVLWQTGQVDVIRAATIERGSMTGNSIAPLEVDPATAIDLDTETDWLFAEWMLPRLGRIVRPAHSHRTRDLR